MSHWLIIYDICDEKRLQKVASTISSYGIRVQKSVFELEAKRDIIDKIRSKINKIIEGKDFVVYFEICERDWQKRMKYGVGRFEGPEERDFYVY